MPIPIRIKVKESNSDIKRMMLDVMASKINECFTLAQPNIEKRIKEMVEKAIKSTPEYISLVSGKLRGDLGVENAKKDMQTIIEIWLNSYKVDPKPVKRVGFGVKGGFTIKCVRADFQDVIYNWYASYFTYKGKSIPWLEWLLLAGDKEVVKRYRVLFREGLPQSRTGLAIMVKNANRNYRVAEWNKSYQGTRKDNMVTRAVGERRTEAAVYNIVNDELERALQLV